MPDSISSDRALMSGPARQRRRRFGGGLLRVLDRRAALDVEPAHVGFAEILVGLEAGGADAGDGAEVVDLVGVAGGGDGADNFALRVADQLAAALEKHR